MGIHNTTIDIGGVNEQVRVRGVAVGTRWYRRATDTTTRDLMNEKKMTMLRGAALLTGMALALLVGDAALVWMQSVMDTLPIRGV
jgi:hypothetical protein